MNLLTVSGISRKGEDEFQIDAITFEQRALQKLVIAGETGSGKSTILKIIAGLVQPDAGEVIFQGERVQGPLEKLVAGHPGIAYLSQHFELPKFLRVEQVLAYANSLSDHEARAIYDICQINHLLKRKTDQLSGGERQRIALARALISLPSLLLLDEPFSNLDMPHKITLKKVIQDLSVELNISVILISHDPLDTLPWAEWIMVMRKGRIIQQDTPEKIYRNPVDVYTAGLFGSVNVIEKTHAPKFGLSREHPLILRPEDFSVTKDSINGVKGEVNRVSYFGSYFELGVAAMGKTFMVRTDHNKFETGEAVYLSINKERLMSKTFP